MHLIDYSKYSPEQLLQVRRTINPKLAGKNFENLIAEIEKRKLEIEAWRNQQKIESESDRFNPHQTRTIAKVISYAQGLCGITLIIYGLFGSGIDSMIAGLFNIACAVLLFKMMYSGFVLSLVNSALQTVSFSTESFAYIYSGLGQVSLHYENGWFGLGAEIGPSMDLFIGKTNYSYFSFDIISFAIFLVLYSMINKEMSNNSSTGPE